MKYIVVSLFFLSCVLNAEVLNVSVTTSTPNVIENEGQYTGFDIDVFNEIINALDKEAVFTEASYVTDSIDDVRTGAVDVGIGAISITHEREETIDFSHPYMDTGLKILIRDNGIEPTFAENVIDFYVDFLGALTSPAILVIGISYIIFILIFAHIIWFVENDHDPSNDDNSVSDSYLPGILESMYFCVITSSTVGYGDYTCKRVVGRLCIVMLILVGVAFFANLTAYMSAEYTSDKMNSDIRGIEDLKNKSVAYKVNTTSSQFVRDNCETPIACPDTSNMISKLEAGEVDAVVFDAPFIEYVAKRNAHLRAINILYSPQKYGFVLKEGSNLTELFNRELIKMKESGRYDEIYNKWF